MGDIKNEIMVMQRDFMAKLRENCLYTENKSGMNRLQDLESKVESFEDEMAQKLSETILNQDKLKDTMGRMRRK